MNVSMMNKDKYISIQELADLKGVSTRAIRMSRDKYVTREIIVRGGKSFEILLSSIELDLQEKYFEQKTQITSKSTALIPILPVKNLPTKVNEIALARLDLLREWQKYRKHHPEGKTRAGIEFIESYNTGSCIRIFLKCSVKLQSARLNVGNASLETRRIIICCCQNMSMRQSFARL